MRTLVLNAGYEPLSVVNYRRALLLVLNNKATVISETDEHVHSVSFSVPKPSVIILNRYIRPPSPRQRSASRIGVLRRDDYTCAYCNEYADTVDHVVPRSHKGPSDWYNLVACCARCNHRKGNRSLNQLGWSLNFTPGPPARHHRWHKDFDRPEITWQPYLGYWEKAS